MTKIEMAVEWLRGTPPEIWKYGDNFTYPELLELSVFPIVEISKLFQRLEMTPVTTSNFTITGILCSQCQNSINIRVSKTRLLEIIGMESGRPRKRDHRKRVLCGDCEKENKSIEAARSREYRDSMEVDDEKRATEFIESFLDPDRSWALKPSEWFSTLLNNVPFNSQDRISVKIKGMEYPDFLSTPYWKAVAQQVKYRARFKCQVCNASNELHVHHRTYLIHGSEHSNLKELICLCACCHSTYHSK